MFKCTECGRKVVAGGMEACDCKDKNSTGGISMFDQIEKLGDMETGRYFITTNTDRVIRMEDSDDIKTFRNMKEVLHYIDRYLCYYLPEEEYKYIGFEESFFTSPGDNIATFTFPATNKNDVVSSAFTTEIVLEVYRQAPVYTMQDGTNVYDDRTPEEMHMSNLLHEAREKLFINLKKVCDSAGGQSACDSFIDSLREDLSVFLDKYVFEYSGDDAEEYFKTLHMPEQCEKK